MAMFWSLAIRKSRLCVGVDTMGWFAIRWEQWWLNIATFLQDEGEERQKGASWQIKTSGGYSGGFGGKQASGTGYGGGGGFTIRYILLYA